VVSTEAILLGTLIFSVVVVVLAFGVDRVPWLRGAVAVIEDALAGTFLVSGLVVVLVSVFMRYVLDNPPGWGDEFARVFVAWGAMFGFSVALRERRHISVDILYTMLAKRGQRVLDFIANLIGHYFSAFMAVAGWQFVAFQKILGLRSIYSNIPEWILMYIIPLSFALFTVRFTLNLIDIVKGREPTYEGASSI